MMTEEEMLIQLHEAETLLQEHGIEVVSSDYGVHYYFINIELCNDYAFYKSSKDGKWYLFNNVLNSYTSGDLEELIVIWKSLY